MNPTYVLVLSCFGIGLAISLAIWALLSDPLCRLEQAEFSGRLAPRRHPTSGKKFPTYRDLKASKYKKMVLDFEDSWKAGEPSLDGYLDRLGGSQSVSLLTMLVETDLRNRFIRGQRPSVARYLEHYPVLARSADRVVSLVYEEYCLLERRGEKPDTAKFCESYPPWRDLILQRLADNQATHRTTM